MSASIWNVSKVCTDENFHWTFILLNLDLLRFTEVYAKMQPQRLNQKYFQNRSQPKGKKFCALRFPRLGIQITW